MTTQTVGGSAAERIRLLIARFIGVGFVAYLIVSISGISGGARILDAWWTPVAVLLVFAPGTALLVASFAAPTLIPLAAASASVGIPVATVLWFFAWNGDQLDGAARGTWLSALAGLAGLCAALVWRPAAAILLQLFTTASAAIVDQLGLFGRTASVLDMFYAAVWAFGITALIAAAVIMAVRTGTLLDATRSQRDEAAAEAAAARAREHERVRFDALIHDRVLSTLLAAGRPEAGHPEAVRRIADDAASALLELDRVAEDPDGGSTTPTQLADEIAAAIASVIAAVGGNHDVALSPTVEDTGAVYSGSVASALCGATAEALRNSLRHAGADAYREVVVGIRSDSVRVVVTDTGVGFDTGTVRPGHLGIEVSIVRRMAEIPGGRSTIDSRPGEGTTVVLEWFRAA